MLPPATVDLKRLEKLALDKLSTTQKHPTLDLLIHNYTPVCQYSKAWDELTLMCRGLITDLKGTIVARPFPKFFNLSEHEGHEVSAHEGFRLPPINWQQDFTAVKKYDGSLGILYAAGPKIESPSLHLATRGSFTSEQALRGTQILHEKQYHTYTFDPNCTYLFEIIFPTNRIVVDYDDMEDLVLLDVIETATGRGLPHDMLSEIALDIGCPVAERIPATAETLQTIAASNNTNEEGYVVRFEDGTRVKIKFEEYVRLHRLVTGVSTKSIWESLANGQGVEELLDRVPDEFNAWVRGTVSDLQSHYDDVLARAQSLVEDLRSRLGDAPQKEYALEIVKHADLAPTAFALMKGKDPAPIIWKMLKPAYSRPFKTDDEA